MPNAMPPIATMPAAKPSSPSTKFTALIETTISKAVIAMEIIGDAVSRPPIGSEMICRPPHATNTEMSSWPASLSIQSRSHTSSATPSRQIIAAPAITTKAWWFWRNSPCRKLSLGGEEHGGDETKQHGHAAHARRWHGVHVTGTHLAHRAELNGEVTDERRVQVRGHHGHHGNEYVDPH